MTLHGRLMARAATVVRLPALIEGNRTVTFGELSDAIEGVKNASAELVDPAEPVAVVTWETTRAIELLLGVPAAGRVVAPISPRSTPNEIASAVAEVGARAMIIDEGLASDAQGALPASIELVTTRDWSQRVNEATSHATSRNEPSQAEDAVAWLLFTSGTTGRPRAARMSHRRLLAALDHTARVRPVEFDDRYLYPFPHWHIAVYNTMARLLAGCPVILHPRFDALRLIDDVAEHRATSLSVAATMLEALVVALESGQRPVSHLASLRQVFYGAAPMPVALLRRAADLIEVDWWQGYGMTETCGNLVFLDPEDHRRGLDDQPELLAATGRPAPGVEVVVVDDHGRSVEPGQPGEIVLRAPQVFDGYLNDPDATAAVLSTEGWLRTGDVGVLDATGLLTVSDRKKDIIITGGENVSAREVEETLRQAPGVFDVAVIGVPDERWGENVCAVVVAEAGFGEDAVLRFARQRLAGFKVPRHVVVTDALPVNASGKVLKTEVRTWLAQDPTLLGPRR